jgi:Undecaprenyl-phosphate glucose phosphotransferase
MAAEQGGAAVALQPKSTVERRLIATEIVSPEAYTREASGFKDQTVSRRRLSLVWLTIIFVVIQGFIVIATGIGAAEIGGLGTIVASAGGVLVAGGAYVSIILFGWRPIGDMWRASAKRFLLIPTALGFAELSGIGTYVVLVSHKAPGVVEAGFGRWAGIWAISAICLLGLTDVVMRGVIDWCKAKGKFIKRVIVYGSEQYVARYLRAAHAEGRQRVVIHGWFDDRAVSHTRHDVPIPFMGGSDAISAFISDQPIDEIVIGLPWFADRRIAALLSKVEHLPVSVRLAPEQIRLWRGRETATATDDVVLPEPISELGEIVKVLFDRTLAAMLLVLLGPIMVVIAALIKLESPDPVIFRQVRPGLGNRPFSIFKFRTMQVACADRQQARPHDARITRVGRWLRKSSLDELPQLINVLIGNMSLVGPRPHPMWERASELWPSEGDQPLEAVIAKYRCRHRVRPGITGWAQVCGYRGSTFSVDQMSKRVECDLYYINNWSFGLDLKILFLTVLVLVSGKNAW